mgnify:CR=1 FL=1
MFLTYEQYVEMGGTLDEAAFNTNERRARGYINLMTHNRIKDETPVRECVKNAVYDLIDTLSQETDNASSAVTGVSSKSNDGVSVTYANWTTVSQYWKTRKRELMVEYLADETVVINGDIVPLLYGGVEYDGSDVT